MGFFSFLFGSKNAQTTPVAASHLYGEEAMDAVEVRAPFAMTTAEDAHNGLIPLDCCEENTFQSFD